MLQLPPRDTEHFINKLKRIDFLGAIVLVAAVFTLLLGLDRGGTESWGDHLAIGCLVSSVVLCVIFGIVETYVAAEPFAPKRIIVNRALIASYLCNTFMFCAGFSNIFQVPLFFQAVMKISASTTGLFLLPSIVGGVLGSLGGGIIMQKTGKYYYLTLLAFSLSLTGTMIVALLTGVLGRSVWGVAIGLFTTSIGNGIGVTTTLIALIANVTVDDQAIATAVSYLFRSLGTVFGISVGSSLVQNSLRKYLSKELKGDDVDELVRKVRESLTYIDQLDPATQKIVRDCFEMALHSAFRFSVIVASMAVISSIFIKEKSLTR